APQARGRDLRCVLRGDAANREGGKPDFSRDFADEREPGKRVELFSLRDEYRADAKIIGARKHGGAGLPDRVRGNADDSTGADDLSGFVYRHVVLTEVYAIGVNEGGHVGPIIDDQQGSRGGLEFCAVADGCVAMRRLLTRSGIPGQSAGL